MLRTARTLIVEASKWVVNWPSGIARDRTITDGFSIEKKRPLAERPGMHVLPSLLAIPLLFGLAGIMPGMAQQTQSADLVVVPTTAGIANGTFAPGQTIDVTWQVSNQAGNTNLTSLSRVYFSNTTRIRIGRTGTGSPVSRGVSAGPTRDDPPPVIPHQLILAHETTLPLQRSSVVAFQQTITVPREATSGIWYLVFVADAENQIRESDETNNQWPIAISVDGPVDGTIGEQSSSLVSIGFEGLGNIFLNPTTYGAFGVESFNIEAQVGQNFGGQGNFCNNGSSQAGGGYDGAGTFNIPNGFNSLEMNYAASGVTVSGFLVTSEVDGGGEVLDQIYFFQDPQNGMEGTTPCAYPNWYSTNTLNFSKPAKSIVFFETLSSDNDYNYYWVDDISFFRENSSVSVSNVPLVVQEGEVGGASFSVALPQQPETGTTVDIKVERVSGTSNSETLQPLGSATVTFNSNNWDQPQDLTVWAPENNADIRNGSATFRVYKSGGTSVLLVDPVSFEATEIDDDFLLTIEPFDSGGTVGGSTFPNIQNQYFDLSDDFWELTIQAVADDGFYISEDWSTVITGEQGLPDQLGNVVLSEPDVLSGGSVERTITAIDLDADGFNQIAIRPRFFEVEPVALNVAVGTGQGMTSPSGTVQAEPGVGFEIEATPAVGWVFTGWTISSGTATFGPNGPGMSTTTVIPETDVTVLANFTMATTPTLAVTHSPAEGGTTDPSGNLSVPVGHVQTITAAANASWRFSFWSVSGGAAFVNGTTANDAAAQIQVTDHATVTANFTQAENVNLTVNHMPSGSGSTNPAGSVSVPDGSVQMISATPSTGNSFHFWSLSGGASFTGGTAASDASAQILLSGDATATANFSQSSNGLNITPNPVTVAEGGPAKQVRVTLDGQPPGDVTFRFENRLGQDAEIVINGNYSTFFITLTPQNWNSGVVLDVEANDDLFDESGHYLYKVTQTNGPDLGLDPVDFSVFEEDDDLEGERIIVTPSDIGVLEGQCDCCPQTVEMYIKLPREPERSLTVEIERRIFENRIQFYPDGGYPISLDKNNWNTGVLLRFCVEAGFTEDIYETFVVKAQNPSEWEESLPATVHGYNDPVGDNAELILTPSTLNIEEGQTAAMTVTLLDPPEGGTTFWATLSNQSDFEFVSSSVLSFYPSNPTRELVFRAKDDEDFEPDTAIVRIDYNNGAGAHVDRAFGNLVEIDDDADVPVLLISPPAINMDPGTSCTFQVSLTKPPETDLSVSLTANATSGNPGLAIESPTGPVTFTPADFDQPRTVTVSASGSGAGEVVVAWASGEPMIESATVPVTIDPLASRLTVDPAAVGFQVGDTGSFQVHLTEPPDSNIQIGVTAVDLSGSPNLEVLSPAGGVLEFTTANYNIPQTVTLDAGGSGMGEIHLDWLGGSPNIPSAVVPVSVQEFSCSGSIALSPNQLTVNEGQSVTFTVTQTNTYHYNRVIEITTGDAVGASFTFEPSEFVARSGVPVQITLTANEDANVAPEDVIFSIGPPQQVSPHCTVPAKSFRAVSIDDDYQLTLQVAGSDGQVTTFPESGVPVFVDTGDYNAANPFPILALRGGAYAFERWTGDVHLLGSLPGSPFSSPDLDPAPIILNFAPNAQATVNLTANYVAIDPEVEEGIDAMLDDLLAQLEIACGLGAANFDDTGLENPGRTGAMSGGRILPHSGQEIREETDLTLPGRDHPTEVRITRRHMTRMNHENSIFGPGWTFNYRIYFTREPNGDLLVNTIGRGDRFELETGSTGAWLGTGARFERMTYDGANKATMRAPSGMKMEFMCEGTPGQAGFKGILSKILSPNGNQIAFTYESGVGLLQRRLLKITDAFGRDVDFVYGPDGSSAWVTEIHDKTDPDLIRTVQYTYDTEGRLTAVRSPTVTTTAGFNDFPNGKLTTYSYHPSNDERLKYALTAVIYPNQNADGSLWPRLTWTYLDHDSSHPLFGYVTGHTLGNTNAPDDLRAGGEFSYAYDLANEGAGVNDVSIRPTVLDRRNTETRLAYNRRGLLLEEMVMADAEGSSKTGEAETFTRTFAYNANGDLIEARRPLSQAVTDDPGVYREAHPDITQKPRLLQKQELRRTIAADSRGGDQEDVVFEQRFEPIFNKFFLKVDPRGLDDPVNPSFPADEVTTYQFLDYMEDLTSAVAAFAPELGMTSAELETEMTEAGIPQALQAFFGIDALGGDTVDLNGDGNTGFQPCGNLVLTIRPTATLPPEAGLLGLYLRQDARQRFWYNDYGQMVRQIDAEGNHTVSEYFPAADPAGLGGGVSSSELSGGGGFLARTIQDAAREPGANSGYTSAPAVKITEFEYGPQGSWPQNLRGVATGVIDPRGIKREMLINELDQTVMVNSASDVSHSPESGLTAYGYSKRQRFDDNGNLVETSVDNRDTLDQTGPDFYDTTYKYDILDQKIMEVRDAGDGGLAIATTFTYDANQNLVEKVTAAGTADQIIERWTYDERDLMLTHTQGADGNTAIGEHAVTTYEYDENGNRTAIIDANGGHRTLFDYDGLDRLKTITDPMGNVTTNHYDAASNIVAVDIFGKADGAPDAAEDELLSRTETNYDERNRAFQSDKLLFHYEGLEVGTLDPGALNPAVVNGLGRVRSLNIFDRLGRTLAVIDADADLSRTDYDGAGRVVRTLDPLANQIENVYDPNDNLITMIETEVDPLGNLAPEVFQTTSSYDALNRLVETVDPVGQVNLREYDSRNNLIKTIDALGNEVEIRHDAINREVSRTVYLSDSGIDASATNHSSTIMTQTGWDAQHRVMQRTDGEGRVTGYGYDDLNRLTLKTYNDGTTESWVYNGDGELQSHRNQNGVRETHNYDAKGRRILTRVPRAIDGIPTFGTKVKVWQYDGLDRVTFAYDDNGQDSGGGQANQGHGVGTRYVYDSLSRPILEVQTLGLEEYEDPFVMGKKVQLEWQGTGRLTGCTYPDGRRVLRTYDGLDRLAEVREGGTSALIAGFDYLGPKRDLRIEYGNGAIMDKRDPLVPTTTLGYGYDQNRRPRQHRWLGPGGSLLVGYDNQYNGPGGVGTNRRISENRFHTGEETTWSYDANYRSVTFNPSSNPRAYARSHNAADKMDLYYDGYPPRLVVLESNDMNQYTNWDGQLFSYDDNANLVEDGDGFTFNYDYQNRLVSILDDVGNQVAGFLYTHDGRRVYKNALDGGTRYIHSQWQVLEERDEDDLVTRQFVDGRSLDEHVQMRVHSDVAPADFYYHLNSQGFVGGMSDAGGNLVEHYEYSWFGEPSIYDAAGNDMTAVGSAAGNPYYFQGRRFDRESGLYYFRHRYYDPTRGEFITFDPKGMWNHGQGNGYSAFNEDPWNARDPMGLDSDGSPSVLEMMWGLMSGGFSGAMEAQERLYDWMGLGLEDESIGPSTFGFSDQQEQQYNLILARNEQNLQIRNLMEFGPMLFGGAEFRLSSRLGEAGGSCLRSVRRRLLRGRYNASGEVPHFATEPPPSAGPPMTLDRNGRWHDAQGYFTREYWPENGGFDFYTTHTLRPGDLVDRYGSPHGSYLAPYYSPFEVRGIKPGSGPYHLYQVMHPFDVWAGPNTPWFGSETGLQYLTKVQIQSLIDEGFLLPLTNP